MNKKIIILSSLLLVSLSIQSCRNDFLEVQPTEAISTNDLSLLNNDAGANSFVTAIYSKYLDWNISSFSWIGVTTIASDEADKGSSPGDTGGDKNLLDALDFNSTGGSFQDIWQGHYQAINRANQALYYLPLRVVTPTAALSSFPYTPKESMNVLRFLYTEKPEFIGSAGPYDATSIHYDNWFTPRYLAIDQGTIGPMIENYRTGLLWKLFMNAPEIKNGLKKLDFKSTKYNF